MFTELGKVLTHPRCVNCHPSAIARAKAISAACTSRRSGAARMGSGFRQCAAPICHQRANFEPARCRATRNGIWHRVKWRWEGKTLGEICAQIKDPERNGGRGLDDLVHHIGRDTLVGWAWAPGFGRQPAPGTQEGRRRLGRGLGKNRSCVSLTASCISQTPTRHAKVHLGSAVLRMDSVSVSQTASSILKRVRTRRNAAAPSGVPITKG